ncbi:PREDICTED: phenolic glucoside malonyltransferase 1-like [Camelina sativa]|uniref:Phenolic glucoside malonyltransferase 1-like n=1 Tax=Camelina sativa TaxID=90675 RepID=A0ABM0V502_CAMSA|nr:PREDICTED: phenolic glucoside malonyltransferase 1-like [Camelina sativa]
MGEEGFLASTRLVSDLVEGLDEGVVWKIPDFVELSRSLPKEAQFLSVSGSTQFGVYGLDFGWGKPEKVVGVLIDQGEAISLAENRDGNGGVEVARASAFGLGLVYGNIKLKVLKQCTVEL